LLIKIALKKAAVIAKAPLASIHAINFSSYNNINLISRIADVPNDVIYFGSADKENIMTHAQGIPVFMKQ
jgi:hypothetical protein